MVEKTNERRERGREGGGGTQKALWCLTVISDRSNRQACREKGRRYRKKKKSQHWLLLFHQRHRGREADKDKDMRSEQIHPEG